MRYVFDENLGVRHAQVLSLCFKDEEFTHVNTMGLQGAKDVELLAKLMEFRPLPILITGDVNMSRRGYEKHALMISGMHCVLIHSNINSMNFSEQVWRFVKIWSTVREKIDIDSNQQILLVNLADSSIKEL